jgi:dipeptidase E
MARSLLLISSSGIHGSGYLEHCEAEVRRHFAKVPSVLFVPYALANMDEYAARVRKRFGEMKIPVTSVHETKDPIAAVEAAAGIFIGGGNTFRLLTRLCENGLLAPIRKRVLGGMPYMGSSAGTNMACPTIKTTNDMPIVYPPSFEALDLVPFQINPHYLDPDPKSTHQGETREQRIREFHEMNAAPVVGLREPAMLEVGDATALLRGTAPARLFRRGLDPVEYEPGARLDFLLDGRP